MRSAFAEMAVRTVRKTSNSATSFVRFSAYVIELCSWLQFAHRFGILPTVNAGQKVQRFSGAFRRSESAALITLAR